MANFTRNGSDWELEHAGDSAPPHGHPAASHVRRPRVLLGISGSIAAYKAADMVSSLKKSGIDVHCVLTPSAREFVSPLVLETLSGMPALWELWGDRVSGTEHVELARWADLVVVAPATANALAKLRTGLADDLLSTVLLATRAPVWVAPAMNTAMLEHAATRENLSILRDRGVRVIEPDSGVLACGEDGAGKLASVERLCSEIASFFEAGIDAEDAAADRSLEGRTLLITAGPTTSPIDAVRYMTNPSTGKMGAALAEEAARRGARVIYVTGVDKGVVLPRSLDGRIAIHPVRTAEEMRDAALARLPEADGVLATAAVLDYRVESPFAQKQKRGSDPMQLELVPSADVLASLRERARPDQWFLGFAAETDSVEQSARLKLERKRLDYVFANRVASLGENSRDTGFQAETNGGTLLCRDGRALFFPVQSKKELAVALWDFLESEHLFDRTADPADHTRETVVHGAREAALEI